MMKNMKEQDKRALLRGAPLVAAILLYVLLLDPLYEHWDQVRGKLDVQQTKLNALGYEPDASAKAKWAGVLKKVPTFAGPQQEDVQRLLFKKQCNEQLKKAGVKVKNLQYVSRAKRQRGVSYKLLSLQCKGSCKQDQMLAMLAGLNENPYLVGVEEMRIKVNPKKRQEMELSITLSTFVR